MNVLDLFSGIGGFSLGLERAGMKTVAFCEIEAYPRAVLQKHWPDVPIWKDVRGLNATELRRAGIGRIDVICGGFPCQDISNAGKRAGIEGERSGLWSEIARLAGELRPRFVIVENVSALLGRGLGRVLGDLAEIGYDAEWHCIPASHVGAPHRRDRIWIMGYPSGAASERNAGAILGAQARERCEGQQDGRVLNGLEYAGTGGGAGDVANARGKGFTDIQGRSQAEGIIGHGAAIRRYLRIGADDHWRTEPNVGRVANGVPSRVDRLRGLGNAVVPQIPEIIGKAILAQKGSD